MDSSSEKERFIKIIRDNKRILYKITYSFCINSEDRKDLEQEIIIQLWKSLKSFNDQYKLSTWLYKVALNVAISFYRKDQKRRASHTSIEEVVFQLSEDDQFEEEVESKTKLLYTFINQLDQFNKAVIILYLEEKTYKEISEILGISESNVGTKINRIKSKLRESFSLLNY